MPKYNKQSSSGYTIVESMIFLAVSGALILMATNLISGQLGKTQFQQSVREFEVALQDIANDISTGNASVPFLPGQICTLDGAGNPRIDTASYGQRCIFLGKVIEFGPAGSNGSQYKTYSVVGKRKLSNTLTAREVTNLREADVRPLTGQVETFVFGSNSARVTKVSYSNNGSTATTGAFGFFTTFQDYGTQGLNSGSINVNVVPITGVNDINRPAGQVASAINYEMSLGPSSGPPVINPSDGIRICLVSQAGNQKAEVLLGGGGNGQLAVTSTISGGTTCS